MFTVSGVTLRVCVVMPAAQPFCSVYGTQNGAFQFPSGSSGLKCAVELLNRDPHPNDVEIQVKIGNGLLEFPKLLNHSSSVASMTTSTNGDEWDFTTMVPGGLLPPWSNAHRVEIFLNRSGSSVSGHETLICSRVRTVRTGWRRNSNLPWAYPHFSLRVVVS
jgi:hypothetical protein